MSGPWKGRYRGYGSETRGRFCIQVNPLGGGHVGGNPYAGDLGGHDEHGDSHGGLNAIGSIRNRGYIYACMAYGDEDYMTTMMMQTPREAEMALEAMLMAFEATMVLAIK